MKFILSSMQIKPDSVITIKAILDGKKVNDLGFIFEQAQMFTTDTLGAEKILYISFTLNQYFGKLSKRDSISAPRIQFEKTTHNFGEITDGDVVATSFKFVNTGKKTLNIVKIKASCGCTATQPSKKVLAPGDSAEITVTFNSKGREGQENKSINVITNDPYHSNISLSITSMVKRKD